MTRGQNISKLVKLVLMCKELHIGTGNNYDSVIHLFNFQQFGPNTNEYITQEELEKYLILL